MFCEQYDVLVALPAALFCDAVIAQDGTLTLGFLVYAHPVVVQIAQRDPEHVGLHFNEFHGPHRLFVFRGALRSSNGHDEERDKKKTCEYTSFHGSTSIFT